MTDLQFCSFMLGIFGALFVWGLIMLTVRFMLARHDSESKDPARKNTEGM